MNSIDLGKQIRETCKKEIRVSEKAHNPYLSAVKSSISELKQVYYYVIITCN